MKNKLTLFISLFLFINMCYSQSNQTTIAQAYYNKAKKEISNGNYSGALNYINKVKETIGKTNPDIIELELKSRFAINKADPEIEGLANTFLSTAYREDVRRKKVALLLVEYREIRDQKIKEEVTAYNDVKASISPTRSINFIKKYPNSKYLDEIKNGLIKLEFDASEKAKAENTVEAYETYLGKFPKDKSSDEIQLLLNVAKEEKLFNTINTSKKIIDSEAYRVVYPDGKYIEDVNIILKDNYLKKVNTALENKDYPLVINYANKYKNNFPNGEQTEFITNSLESAQRANRKQENQQIRETNRTSANYFMATYELEDSFGFEFGKLHTEKVSMYFNLRLNANMINALGGYYQDNDDIEYSPVYAGFIDEISHATSSLSLGLNYKVYYPIWVYAGAGVSYNEYFIGESEEERTKVVNFKDEITFSPEGGIKLKLGKIIVLKAGVKYDQEIKYMFGLAFQTRNW